MEHPDLNHLIARTIQADRLRTAERERRIPRGKSIGPIRERAGRALIAIGTRIAATPRTVTSSPVIGEISLAGRADT